MVFWEVSESTAGSVVHTHLPTCHWPELKSHGLTFLQGGCGIKQRAKENGVPWVLLSTHILCHKEKAWKDRALRVHGTRVEVKRVFMRAHRIPSTALNTFLRAKGLLLFHTPCNASPSRKFTLLELSRFVFYLDLSGIPVGLPTCPLSPQEFSRERGKLSNAFLRSCEKSFMPGKRVVF